MTHKIHQRPMLFVRGRHSLAVLAATALVAIALPGHAGNGANAKHVESFEVHFPYNADSKPEKTFATFKRIARKQCRMGMKLTSPSARRIADTCYDDLLADAVSRTGDRSLMAIHQAAGGAVPLMAGGEGARSQARPRTAVLSGVERKR